MDGKVCACLVFAPEAQGRDLLTVESSADGVDGDHLHPLQQTSSKAPPCSAASARRASPWPPRHCSTQPRSHRVRDPVRPGGHLCRCTATTRSSAPSGSGCTAQEWRRDRHREPRPTSGRHLSDPSRRLRQGRGKAASQPTSTAGPAARSVPASPHAHANIASIDTSKAEAMLGVKAVVTGDDFPHSTSPT